MLARDQDKMDDRRLEANPAQRFDFCRSLPRFRWKGSGQTAIHHVPRTFRQAGTGQKNALETKEGMGR